MDAPDELLSEELRQALGDSPDLVMASVSKKDKTKERRPLLAPEIIQQAKKLSKKQQKRVDQINKRKMREANKGEYLKTISSHQITGAQRQLMSSAQSLGQSLSLKQTVALLLKKEKAGLSLSEEEMEVLYPKKREAFDIAELAARPEFQMHVLAPVGESDDVLTPVTGDLMGLADVGSAIDVSDLFTSMNSKPTEPEPTVMDVAEISDDTEEASMRPATRLPSRGKRRPLRQPLRALAQASAVSTSVESIESVCSEAVEVKLKKKSVSLGKSLLEQLQSLKAKSDQEHDTREVEAPGVDMLNSIDNALPADQAYHMEEITAPVTELGLINPLILARLPADLVGRPAKAAYVQVRRPAEVVTARMGLPVCGMEQEIVEAVRNHDVIIVCGETGSGKSTQIPQFLYEAGFAQRGLIGITQPRRVAVTSTAERVNYEMGQTMVKSTDASGRLVGYQIRYDSSTVGEETRIKFMTDGILLREVTQDLLLRQYSALLLDEAHERNLNTDVLLGMLSRAIPLRRQVAAEEQKVYDALPEDQRAFYQPPLQPLKVVIMSATLRVTDFQAPHLFSPAPPVVQVDARQFPVTTHFAKKTELRNYLQATFRKVSQIHRKLPQGGVLVFLTGKREILYMCHKLQRALGERRAHPKASAQTPTGTEVAEKEGDAEGDKEAEFFDAEAADLENGDSSSEWAQLDAGGSAEGVQELDFAAYGDAEGLDEIESHASSLDMDDDSDLDSDDESGEEAKGNAQPDGPGSSGNASDAPEGDELSMGSKEQDPGENEDEDDDEDEGAATRRRMLAEVLGTSRGGDRGAENNPSSVAAALVTEGNAASGTPVADTGAEGEAVAEAEEPPQLKPLILPLYAMMPPALQAKIFAAVPEGYRLIVVATNVAETSITIPGISYVVDSGRQKTKVTRASASQNGQSQGQGLDSEQLDSSVAVSKYEIQWISKASADQRQGRAGRTGPGHCYRLFSANFYHQYMPAFQPPEITTTPLEDLVLQMKALGIQRVESYPFPSMPPLQALRSAVKILTYLGALVTPQAVAQSNMDRYLQLKDALVQQQAVDKQKVWDDIQSDRLSEKLMGELTSVGKLMARFPVHPRLGKMLILACRAVQVAGVREGGQVLAHALSLVAALAERSPFVLDEGGLVKKKVLRERAEEGVDENDLEEPADEDAEPGAAQKQENPLLAHPHGDCLARLRAVGAYIFACHQALPATASATNLTSRRLREALGKDVKVLELCRKYQLHLPTLQRMLDLRSQLQTVALRVLSSERLVEPDEAPAVKQWLAPPLAPPSSSQEVLLRQLLLSGFCDSIARKAPVSVIQAAYSNSAQVSRRKKYTAYLSANPNVHQPVYLHPQSNLYPTDPTDQMPEFLVYHGLQFSTKGDTLYMQEATVVDLQWIAQIAHDSTLLKFSPPLPSPAPSYDATADCIFAYSVPRYGAHNWKLPAVKKPLAEILQLVQLTNVNGESSAAAASTSTPLGYRKEDEEYRWFARFLLEGGVGLVPKTALCADLCVVPTNMITQNKMHPKVLSLLRQLVTHKIVSKQALVARLATNAGFLSNEIQALLKPESRPAFRSAWLKLSGAKR